MRKLLFVVFSLLVSGATVMAQNKVDTKWHCPKQSADHKFDVGDMPDHSYMILQGTCKATSSGSGFAEKSGAYTEFREMWKASFSWHGRFNVTMDNGDMVYYTYEGSKPASNKWTIHNGTGKYEGIKGSGTCSGTLHEDGSSDWECAGRYSMGQVSRRLSSSVGSGVRPQPIAAKIQLLQWLHCLPPRLTIGVQLCSFLRTMGTVRTGGGFLQRYPGKRTQTPSSSPDPFSC